MSACSSISVRDNEANQTHSIYCYWGGSIKDNGRMLIEHYNNFEAAKSLALLGNIATLRETIECVDGHSYDNPVANATVFYGRDRGEDGEECSSCETYEGALAANYGAQEYDYIFHSRTWFVSCKESNGYERVDVLLNKDVNNGITREAFDNDTLTYEQHRNNSAFYRTC